MKRVLLAISVIMIAFGLYRLMYIQATLPSYKFILLGGLLLAYVLTPPFSLETVKKKLIFREKYLLMLLVAAVFLFRIYPHLLHSIPIGYDTSMYMSRISDAAGNPAAALTFDEPMMYWFAAPFHIFGGEWGVILFISLISALAVVPFYFIIKKFFPDAALLASVIFVLAPLELRFASDLYKNTLAILFMMLAFYFLVEKRWLPLFASALLMSLTHFTTALVFVFTAYLYLLSNKELKNAAKLTVILAIIAVPAGIWFFGYAPHKEWYGIAPDSFSVAAGQYLKEAYDQVFYSSGIFIIGAIGAYKLRKRGEFFFSFLVAAMLLTMLGFTIIYMGHRFMMFAEIPLMIFAARYLQTKSDKLILFCLLWVIIDMITFGTLILQPYPELWPSLL